jgi:hypothetical protein
MLNKIKNFQYRRNPRKKEFTMHSNAPPFTAVAYCGSFTIGGYFINLEKESP